ncbi:unnamed protein product, partial [marine sediment metagenome]
SVKLHQESMLKKGATKDKLYEHYFNKYNKFSLYQIMNMLLFKDVHDFRKDVIMDVWKEGRERYVKECEYLGCDLTKTVLLMDLSASIFNNNHIQNTVGIALLISEMTTLNKDYLIINKRNPEFLNFGKDDSIFQKVEKILNNCCQSSNIYLDNSLTSSNDLLVLSDKEMNEMSGSTNKCDYRIVYWKYESKESQNNSRSYVLIKKIIEESAL